MRSLEQHLAWWSERRRAGGSTDFTCLFRDGPFLIRRRSTFGGGPSFQEYALNGRFDDADDALGWLRFVGLPHLLRRVAGVPGDVTDVDAAHPEQYAPAEGRAEVVALLGLLEATIDAAAKGQPDFDAVRAAWNGLFAHRRPADELLAIGEVAAVVESGIFNSWLDEFVDLLEEEGDEEEYQAWSALRTRIGSGELDLDDPAQADLVQRLLEATSQC